MQFDWLLYTSLEIWSVVLFWWSFLIFLEKYANKSKKWCNSWINRTDESQSDCKGHQWSQNRCNKEDYNGFLMVDHKRYWHLNLIWFLFWFFSFRLQATGFHSRIPPVAWSPMSTNDLRNWSLFIAWGRGVGKLWLSVNMNFTWSINQSINQSNLRECFLIVRNQWACGPL